MHSWCPHYIPSAPPSTAARRRCLFPGSQMMLKSVNQRTAISADKTSSDRPGRQKSTCASCSLRDYAVYSCSRAGMAGVRCCNHHGLSATRIGPPEPSRPCPNWQTRRMAYMSPGGSGTPSRSSSPLCLASQKIVGDFWVLVCNGPVAPMAQRPCPGCP